MLRGVVKYLGKTTMFRGLHVALTSARDCTKSGTRIGLASPSQAKPLASVIFRSALSKGQTGSEVYGDNAAVRIRYVSVVFRCVLLVFVQNFYIRRNTVCIDT